MRTEIAAQAGRMHQRVEIQTLDTTVVPNTFNEVDYNKDGNWGTLAKRWAEIEPKNGREMNEASQNRADVTHKIKVHYFAGLVPTMRFALRRGGQLVRVFTIAYVLNIQERSRVMICLCKEEIPKVTTGG